MDTDARQRAESAFEKKSGNAQKLMRLGRNTKLSRSRRTETQSG